jgi:hypothetical protein
VASLQGWIDVAKCLIEFGADVNAQDRWKNTVSSSSSFPAFGCRFICLFCVFLICMGVRLWWLQLISCHVNLDFLSLQPLADAEGAKKHSMIELLKSYGGLSYVSTVLLQSFIDTCFFVSLMIK